MGFFPYYARREHPNIDMYFVDTYGLCDRTVAHMGLPANAFGYARGLYLRPILAGERGELSDYVIAKCPRLVFGTFDATHSEPGYELIGYKPVAKDWGMHVFYTPFNGDELAQHLKSLHEATQNQAK